MKIVLLLIVSCAAAFAQAGRDAALQLDELIQEALQNNPELRAFDANREAAQARIPQMSSLDDPRFDFEIEEAPRGAPFNTSQWKYVNFGLTQMLPFPGKLAKAKKLAEIDAQHAHHDYAEKTLDIIANVKAAYFELYMIQRGLEVNQENINLMTQFVNIAKIRYAIGQVMNQDVLKANVELARLANAQITLQQQEETVKAMLNVLRNRAPQAPLGQTVLPERGPLSFELEALQRTALAYRPMLHHDSLGVAQSRIANSLARRQYWPDFDLSLKYVASPYDGFRGFTAMAGVSLPFSFWSIKKQRGRVEETAAETRMKEAMVDNTKNMILFAVQDGLAKVQSAQRMLELYRATILPQAEQALQVTLANYQTRQTDFLMLLDSYRMLQMSKMEYYEAEAKYEMSLAELERAVGKKLE
ncbi:MAG: TolC family protein [candidate division KSB1 bacterium]